METNPRLITKEEAKALGLKRYFTGKPCLNGHLVERYAMNGGCAECRRLATEKCAPTRKEKKAEYDKVRAEKYRVRRANLDAARYKSRKKEYAARWAAYYTTNRRDLNRKNRIWREANQHWLEAWREANRDILRERSRIHYRANKEDYRARGRARRAMIKGAEGSHTHMDVIRLKSLQRNKCACCKKSLSSGYHVDHVQPISKGGSNGPSNLQILCPNCNLRKGAKDPIEWRRQQGMLI